MNSKTTAFIIMISGVADSLVSRAVTASRLQSMELKEPTWIVTGLLPEGLAAVVGRPKVGKSWWVLLLALCVALGWEFLGMAVVRGAVLYLAFEDNKIRLRDRLQKLSEVLPDNLYLFSMSELGDITDRLGLVEKFLLAHPECKLVIIDTLQRFRPPMAKNSNLYEADTAFMSSVQALALRFGVCILFVHHCRKSPASDIFDTISGSQGIFGTCDTILVFGVCKSGCRELHVTGRDVEQCVLAIRQTDFTWTLEGDAETVRLSARRREIVAVFQSAPDRVLTLREIKESSEMSAGVLKNTLRLLVADGAIIRMERNRYRLSTRKA